MSYSVTFKCDTCGKNYLLNDMMELPPLWLGVQLSISNSVGIIPPHESEIFNHFCSQECLIKFTKGNGIKERKCMVDRDYEQDVNGGPDDEEEDEN